MSIENEPPVGQNESKELAELTVTVSFGEAQFVSSAVAGSDQAWTVFTMAKLSGDGPWLETAALAAPSAEAREFSRAAAVLADAAGRYHAALEARRAAK